MLKRTFFINGVETRVIADAKASLSKVLRNQLFLYGTKEGCKDGACGTCMVIVDGKAVKSCRVSMGSIPEDAHITTIEGVGTEKSLHPLQLSWLIHGIAQCGLCAPGMIVAAKALLDQNPSPARDEVLDWLSSNVSMSGGEGLEPVADAVMDAAKLMRGDAAKEELWRRLKDDSYTEGAEWQDQNAVAAVTGALAFGSDFAGRLPEGTLYMKLVQPAAYQAAVYAIDASEAEKMPGVYKVLTWKDIKGSNRISASKKIFADKMICEPGDPAAAVLAFTPGLAEEAADLVKVRLEETPGRESTAETPALPQEAGVGFAYINEKGKLVIHSQKKEIDTAALAEGIGVPSHKLSLVKLPVSKAFDGSKHPAIEGIVGAAALLTEKPVYLEI